MALVSCGAVLVAAMVAVVAGSMVRYVSVRYGGSIFHFSCVELNSYTNKNQQVTASLADSIHLGKFGCLWLEILEISGIVLPLPLLLLLLLLLLL